METELIIEGCGFPPLSARGCSQELTEVPQGEFRRTVNGNLAYLGPDQHKYQSVIRCEDKVTLVNEGVLARGMVVRIGCLQRLWQQCQNGCVTLEREAVSGSIVAMDGAQKPLSVRVLDSKTVEVARCMETMKLLPSLKIRLRRTRCSLVIDHGFICAYFR
jgi:hypothetical protein